MRPVTAKISADVPPRELSVDAVATRLRSAGCVFAEDEAALLVSAARTPTELARLVERRMAGLPLEQVLGWAEFCGVRIAVKPGVFVPRRRTELMVREAAGLVREAAASLRSPAPVREVPVPVVVDLCCGSGAVGAALAAALGDVELYAVDLDPAAVRCARRNIAEADGQVFEGDLDEPLPAGLRGRVDILAANVPYVPTDAIGLMPPEARMHEHMMALDGGADGLDLVRRVAAVAPRWLAPGGHLLVETSEQQAPLAAEAFTRNGLEPGIVSSEELNATVVIGTMAGR